MRSPRFLTVIPVAQFRWFYAAVTSPVGTTVPVHVPVLSVSHSVKATKMERPH
jgi:hypothetical protein